MEVEKKNSEIQTKKRNEDRGTDEKYDWMTTFV